MAKAKQDLSDPTVQGPRTVDLRDDAFSDTGKAQDVAPIVLDGTATEIDLEAPVAPRRRRKSETALQMMLPGAASMLNEAALPPLLKILKAAAEKAALEEETSSQDRD